MGGEGKKGVTVRGRGSDRLIRSLGNSGVRKGMELAVVQHWYRQAHREAAKVYIKRVTLYKNHLWSHTKHKEIQGPERNTRTQRTQINTHLISDLQLTLKQVLHCGRSVYYVHNLSKSVCKSKQRLVSHNTYQQKKQKKCFFFISTHRQTNHQAIVEWTYEETLGVTGVETPTRNTISHIVVVWYLKFSLFFIS